MKLSNKPGGIVGFTENIAAVHLVAFGGDIEIGKPLVLSTADRFGLTFAIQVFCGVC